MHEGLVASSDRSEMMRIIARGLGGRGSVPFGRSSWSGNPLTNLENGSKGATVVDGGALRDFAERGTGLRCRPCLPRSANANT